MWREIYKLLPPYTGLVLHMSDKRTTQERPPMAELPEAARKY